MRTDSWESGNLYEQFMGRWSRPVAVDFLDWLSVPEQQIWMDVGCGTGVLTASILERAAPRQVLAIDASDAFVAYASQAHRDARGSLSDG